MKASEGKPGRVFMVRLEEGDDPVRCIEDFAAGKRIQTAQVFVVSKVSLFGIIAPDGDGNPRLRLPEGAVQSTAALADSEVMIQEVAGIAFRRVVDPASGRESFTRVPSTKTRVMEKPAPAPETAGPGTIPVYLFNAEFN